MIAPKPASSAWRDQRSSSVGWNCSNIAAYPSVPMLYPPVPVNALAEQIKRRIHEQVAPAPFAARIRIAAHDHKGAATHLARNQLGGGRNLARDGHQAGAHHTPEVVRLAAIVAEGRHARDADRDV